ncbi:YchJ family protein [Methylomonas sp. MED-D]|uniref:YchJ family protein n=1 Tax=unclassified Methylomonas TaxID=2608980 RepID=UPI0028A3FC17|nr:YchJ family protein [Methylomonas sp. MV1]MDT4328610.1 YchJ family protein [Methylomonas sp. MV1]
MITLNTENSTCLCDSGLSYADCCQPFHDGRQIPKTAAALMRSRFTAYAGQNAAYLLDTWAIETRPPDIDFSKESANWQSLTIVDTKKGGELDAKGIVEFKAFYRQDDNDHFMHEISRFVKTGGRWYYLDGKIKAAGRVGITTDTGRNAPCACGSGKKFKRCCGR